MILNYKVLTSRPDAGIKKFERTISRFYSKSYLTISVPKSIGEGRYTSLELLEDFQVTFQFFRLSVPLHVTKTPSDGQKDTISIIFYDLEIPEAVYMAGNKYIYEQAGINMYTGDNLTDLNLQIPANTVRRVVSLHIRRSRLESMLGDCNREFLSELLQNRKSFFIHEQLSKEMRVLIRELSQPPAAKALVRLFYHARSLQLLYCLLEQLNKRTLAPARSINALNISKIFQVRALLTKDLSTPPAIPDLAKTVLMSESYLKQLFREVFGESIYQFYQNNRLAKARELLLENKKTVREIGFELGFSNIGHFSRLFERTYHIKPKKFQMKA